MAKGCKKCDPHEICEECPEWIFTLADLIMCMMGLFVLLWVLKPSGNPNPGNGSAQSPASAASMSEERLTEVMAAIREALDYQPNLSNPDKVDLHMLMKKLAAWKAARGGHDRAGDAEQRKDGAEGVDDAVTTIRIGKQTAEGGPLLFNVGETTPGEAMRTKVAQLARLVRGHRNIVMIKGHTALDDFPDTATAEQRMDLSIRRAQAIADMLVSMKVEPDILRVQGCSTFEPVKMREYSTATQSVNRRVEVEVTATLVSELQDQRK